MFEDENKRLGELTDDVLKERGENRQFIPNYSVKASSPLDLTTPSKPYRPDPTVPGAKPGPKPFVVPVQSVFDTRPVNARDWFMPIALQNTVGGGAVGEVFASVDFPQGFIGILREFSVQIFYLDGTVYMPYMSAHDSFGANPRVVFGISSSASVFQLEGSSVTAIMGAIDPTSESMREQLDRQKTHIIVPENATLYVGVQSLPAASVGITMELYGTLILSKGRSTNMEIAT